jgi:hypothetical protein
MRQVCSRAESAFEVGARHSAVLRRGQRDRASFPRLAYASRSWCTPLCPLQKATFSMHIRTCTKIGGRRPAVIVCGKCVPAPNRRSRSALVTPPCCEEASVIAQVSHGWLTPAAPGAHRYAHCKKRHFRCTSAHAPRSADVSPPCCRATWHFYKAAFSWRALSSREAGTRPRLLSNSRALSTRFRQ